MASWLYFQSWCLLLKRLGSSMIALKTCAAIGPHSRDALKLAHLPKCCPNSLDFFQRFLPLHQGMIKLTVESLHHPSLFFGRKLIEILFTPFGRKNFHPVQTQDTPTAIARLDQRLEFPLRIAPIQQ